MEQLYDADLRTMDERLGELLFTLDAVGALNESLVVIVSDHGEHLGEFDLLGHQHSVFDSVVSVPLAIRYPDQNGGRTVDEQVEIRRIFHTILDRTGVRSYPEQSLASGNGDPTAYGEFFTPMIDIEQFLWDRNVVYDSSLIGERLSFVRRDGRKLVRYADEEWLFETPERRETQLSPETHSSIYERFFGEPTFDEQAEVTG